MPGHDGVVPVAAMPCGGARGCRYRSKVSMMTMCPPQHGHGGRTSVGSSIGSVWGGGATFSNWRARARLVLRAELASSP